MPRSSGSYILSASLFKIVPEPGQETGGDEDKDFPFRAERSVC